MDRTWAVDMSARLALDNVALLERDAAAAAVGDAAAVVVADCILTASKGAHCKAAVSSCRVVFDCTQCLTVAPARRSESGNGYRQRDLRTAAPRPLGLI